MNSRTSMAQRDDIIRRTVYVSDIDHQVKYEYESLVYCLRSFVHFFFVFKPYSSCLTFAFFFAPIVGY